VEVGVGRIGFLNAVPDTLEDDTGGNSAFDVELFAVEIDGIEGGAVGGELLQGINDTGVLLLQSVEICHGVALLVSLTDCCVMQFGGRTRGPVRSLKTMPAVAGGLDEFAEKALRHAAHGAGRSGLPIGSEVLDDHRQNSGESSLNDLRRDSGFFCCFFDEASSAEALLDLVGCGCGTLPCGPVADVLCHSVVLEGVENALNAFRMLGESFDETAGDLCLVRTGSGASLTGERLNRIQDSHVVH